MPCCRHACWHSRWRAERAACMRLPCRGLPCGHSACRTSGCRPQAATVSAVAAASAALSGRSAWSTMTAYVGSRVAAAWTEDADPPSLCCCSAAHRACCLSDQAERADSGAARRRCRMIWTACSSSCGGLAAAAAWCGSSCGTATDARGSGTLPAHRHERPCVMFSHGARRSCRVQVGSHAPCPRHQAVSSASARLSEPPDTATATLWLGDNPCTCSCWAKCCSRLINEGANGNGSQTDCPYVAR
jgi:hypothetical protein